MVGDPTLYPSPQGGGIRQRRSQPSSLVPSGYECATFMSPSSNEALGGGLRKGYQLGSGAARACGRVPAQPGIAKAPVSEGLRLRLPVPTFGLSAAAQLLRSADSAASAKTPTPICTELVGSGSGVGAQQAMGRATLQD